MGLYDMPDSSDTIIMQIQNSRKPEQIISVVMSDLDSHFETRGLKGLFDLDEIRIERDEFLTSMEEFAILLSFLLETMSEAKELNLPYAYMEDFEYRGRKYSLVRQNDQRVLKRKEPNDI